MQAAIPIMVHSVELETRGKILHCKKEKDIEVLDAGNNAVNLAGKVLGTRVNEPAVFETSWELEVCPQEFLDKAPRSHRKTTSLTIGIPLGADCVDGEEIYLFEDDASVAHHKDKFEGFLVDVRHIDSDASDSEVIEQHNRLLQEESFPVVDIEGQVPIDALHNPMILSIPLEAVKQSEETTKAYLITMPIGITPNPNDPNYVSIRNQTAQAVPNPIEEDEDDGDDATFPALKRALSHVPGFSVMETAITSLPTDHLLTEVECVTLEAVGLAAHSVEAAVEHRVPLIGYILLAMSLIATSSYGPAMKLQVDVISALLKLYWRFTAVALFLLPLAIKGLWCGKDNFKMGQSFTTRDVIELLGASFCFTTATSGYILALNYTDVGTVVLFAGTHSIILVLAKVVMGIKVAMLEGSGAAVGVLGAMLTTLDDSGSNIAVSEYPHPNIGKCLGVLSAAGTAGYLLLACTLRSKIDLFTFMCILFTVASFILLGMMTLVGIPFEASTNSSRGLFGWINMEADRFPLELYIVMVCTLVGNAGLVAVMKYFEALVLSVVSLLQPVVAVVLGLLFGVGGIPGKWMCTGGIFVSLGCLMVVSSASKKAKSYDGKDAVPKVSILKDNDGKIHSKCTKTYGAVEMGSSS